MSPSDDTRGVRIVRSKSNSKGWCNLEEVSGESIADIEGQSLLQIVHLSDIHICDAQSPARVEALDRYADPHNLSSALIPLVGTYRAQEILTTQTFEALIRKINRFQTGLVSNRPIDAVVITGDVIDNAQQNELDWYLEILHGGVVISDSGDLSKWEGAASTDPNRYDRSFWNPEGTPEGCEDDYPRDLYGFPVIKGLLEVVRAPFISEGLRYPWFSTHGNHDALLQGTVPVNDEIATHATGFERITRLKPDVDLRALFETFDEVGPASYPNREMIELETITPDAARELNKKDDWIQIHNDCGHDHGYRDSDKKYWSRDIGPIRLISLDTVNPHGGWQGSLGRDQFNWLNAELSDQEPRFFIILSHHPATTLFNLYDPIGEGRVGEKEVVELLLSEPRVVAWLAGHQHKHSIDFRTNSGALGFWEIETASNIDWPQQGRRIEVIETEEEIAIVTAVFDHVGDHDPNLETAFPDIETLAGISRVLSANDWQRRHGEFSLEKNAGLHKDRNSVLLRRKALIGLHRKFA